MKLYNLLAAVTVMGALLGSLRAAGEEPSLRLRGEWIILSGTAEQAFGRGPTPWSHAILRSAVTSVSIRTDFPAFDPTDGADVERFHDATAEELHDLPAVIEITTSEIGVDSGNKKYLVRGLTHATAPRFMEMFLEMVAESPSESEED